MKKLFGAALLALASLFGNAATQDHVLESKTEDAKQAMTDLSKQIKPVAIKNRFGGFSGQRNPYKLGRKGLMNQRQLRKHLRQNPHIRKKYGK